MHRADRELEALARVVAIPTIDDACGTIGRFLKVRTTIASSISPFLLLRQPRFTYGR